MCIHTCQHTHSLSHIHTYLAVQCSLDILNTFISSHQGTTTFSSRSHSHGSQSLFLSLILSPSVPLCLSPCFLFLSFFPFFLKRRFIALECGNPDPFTLFCLSVVCSEIASQQSLWYGRVWTLQENTVPTRIVTQIYEKLWEFLCIMRLFLIDYYEWCQARFRVTLLMWSSSYNCIVRDLWKGKEGKWCICVSGCFLGLDYRYVNHQSHGFWHELLGRAIST